MNLNWKIGLAVGAALLVGIYIWTRNPAQSAPDTSGGTSQQTSSPIPAYERTYTLTPGSITAIEVPYGWGVIWTNPYPVNIRIHLNKKDLVGRVHRPGDLVDTGDTSEPIRLSLNEVDNPPNLLGTPIFCQFVKQ